MLAALRARMEISDGPMRSGEGPSYRCSSSAGNEDHTIHDSECSARSWGPSTVDGRVHRAPHVSLLKQRMGTETAHGSIVPLTLTTQSR